MNRLEVARAPEAVAPDATDWWRRVVSANSVPPSGADMTAAPEWHVALARAFSPEGGARMLVVRGDGGAMACVLPVCRLRGGGLGQPGETVGLLTELYGGRVALICQGPGVDVARTILAGLDREFPSWSCFEMTLVDGHEGSAQLLDGLRRHAFAADAVALDPSPYIELPDSFDAYFSTLKANFRTEVRRGERRLREEGTLTRRLFTEASDVDDLWSAVSQIERQSWKESAGTSITKNPFQERFYRAFLPLGAEAGQLLAAVLFLDGRPIAHQLCLQRDTTAAILKMSYAEDLRRFYPSTVLLAGYLKDAIDRGMRILDFMGRCDEFKIRWTKLTYGRTRHLLFRDSFAGRLAFARYKTVQCLRDVGSVLGRRADAAVDTGQAS